ncbi:MULTISPECIES: ParB/RepB/Spo0J family partition protein [Gammaproteobacteria]|jgi:ParB family chromosome partitioning protein|uniref:Chromosome partitioning protein ParB n=1 Tax=Vibrio alginolyticus TaxID=663 RepID=A0A2K9UZ74_VIBAL|nr:MULTISPECIES: ParB/RepB/Spo0J family partition protein [Gammaproteobacteria]EAY3929526.1 ParB/RepB/Spo0J family partition protein [Salmonella enterica]HCE3569189.1 ParB/RepB/Spo0J family partition protein [Vibrio parahaemolyticus]AUV50308.1 chromosome partitioning protein ParB [Vibrio alginolyticus]AWX05541.1 chromosome partitioning protein ParB [Enterobacter hormaechei]MDW3058859.1 ParB/RepB/Spo0J family partition protein [Vibrio sp. 1978]
MTDKTTPKSKGADLSGLDDFNLSSFLDGGKKGKAQEDAGNAAPAGAVSYAPLDHFHEDEDNARQEFDAQRLQELAESMTQVNPKTGEVRGILEPLSVKHHPDKPGHFIINGGARRYRAAKLAGLEQAPYIIKDELDDFDKFVLNDQREQLSPLEIAMFIKARLDEGYSKTEVAKALGRPASYVSDHVIFFDMAGAIRDLYDSERCRSMQALALLHRAHKKNPEPVEAFCQDANENDQELTTSQVRAFLESLKKPEGPKEKDEKPTAPTGDSKDQEPQAPKDEDDNQGDTTPASETQLGEGDTDEEPGDQFPDPSTRNEDQQPLTLDGEPLSGGTLEGQADQMLEQDEKADRIKKAIIQVKHDEREARLLTERRAAYGLAWIKYDDDGQEVEVDLNQVALVAVIEA